MCKLIYKELLKHEYFNNVLITLEHKEKYYNVADFQNVYIFEIYKCVNGYKIIKTKELNNKKLALLCYKLFYILLKFNKNKVVNKVLNLCVKYL